MTGASVSDASWLLLAIVAVTSCLLTGAVRRYAMRRLVDVPNARSSHAVPTPRGGGLAIVLCFAAGVSVVGASELLPWRLAILGLIVPGLVVALVGFLDDHGHVPARWRLLAHAGAATIALYALSPLPPLAAGGTLVGLGALGVVLALLFLVWMLNLFNFMDGIDGIAGVEAVTVGAGGALVHWLRLPGDAGWLPPALLAAASLGFLVWNAPRARIFMGDVGSGFLGVAVGVLALLAARAAPELFWAWVILVAVFVSDATVTLVRRALRGARVYEAHRSHAYQHAARRWREHRLVTAGVGLINVGWLFPLAALVATGHLDGMVATGIAYLPMVFLALRMRAGLPEAALPGGSAER